MTCSGLPGPASFEILDHTADVKVRVWGGTLPELFEHAAIAMFSVIGELARVSVEKELIITIEGLDLVDLLVRWLNELLHRFDLDHTVFCEFSIDELEETRLRGRARGEPIDFDRHQLETEIKAVTYHEAKVLKQHDRWVAEILFDV